MEELEQPPTVETAPVRPIGGLRRAAITGLLAIGMLVVGGVAAVSAADPSASPAPTTETTPDASDDAGTQGETDGGTRPECDKDDASTEDVPAT